MTPRTLSFAGCTTRSEAADLLRVFVEQNCVDDLLAMQADDATIVAYVEMAMRNFETELLPAFVRILDQEGIR